MEIKEQIFKNLKAHAIKISLSKDSVCLSDKELMKMAEKIKEEQ